LEPELPDSVAPSFFTGTSSLLSSLNPAACQGGRIKTETVDGFQLDHGFQVLQTGYPEASKTLDFKKLKLKKFPAGVNNIQ
jgi:hypothetical protein